VPSPQRIFLSHFDAAILDHEKNGKIRQEKKPLFFVIPPSLHPGADLADRGGHILLLHPSSCLAPSDVKQNAFG